jgi:hypothetical protein
MEIQTLTLLFPLYYAAAESVQLTKSDPFNYRKEDGEKLYCFLLDENERSSFEPDRETLLGRLVFSQVLPEGNYLFAQKRDILSRDEIIDMAVEIQAEGLWQRLKPGNMLYLRYLFEDSKAVTQLFRPYS